MIREEDHDSQIARCDLLASLDAPQILRSAKSFRAALQKPFERRIPAGVFSASTYKWAWRGVLQVAIQRVHGPPVVATVRGSKNFAWVQDVGLARKKQ